MKTRTTGARNRLEPQPGHSGAPQGPAGAGILSAHDPQVRLAVTPQLARPAKVLPPVGLTLLPLPAVEALGWGRGSAPSLYAAACKRLDLGFVFLPASEPWAKDAIDCILAAVTAPFWVVSGPFGAVANRDGWIESLRATESNPQMIAGRMDAAMPDLFEQALSGAQLGAAAIVIAEDVAGANGPLLSGLARVRQRMVF